MFTSILTLLFLVKLFLKRNMLIRNLYIYRVFQKNVITLKWLNDILMNVFVF